MQSLIRAIPNPGLPCAGVRLRDNSNSIFATKIFVVINPVFCKNYFARNQLFPHWPEQKMKRMKAFTLIELIVTIAIVAILTAIAVPNYSAYVVRGKRSAAQSAMMNIADREQQMFIANRSYSAASNTAPNGFSVSPDVSANYTWAVTVGTGTVPSFVVTFTPIGSQASDSVLTLNNLGVKTPSSLWQR